ncbi:MAG: hypothetical protein LBU60_00595 [Clostridiales bacterium]|jgi:hypothetical protein|nr:hypothetical protein [Clostridiales bacterium]
MKIISQGSVWPKRETCLHCRSVLEYGKDDVRQDFEGSELYIKCPICGRHEQVFQHWGVNEAPSSESLRGQVLSNEFTYLSIE